MLIIEGLPWLLKVYLHERTLHTCVVRTYICILLVWRSSEQKKYCWTKSGGGAAAPTPTPTYTHTRFRGPWFLHFLVQVCLGILCDFIISSFDLLEYKDLLEHNIFNIIPIYWEIFHEISLSTDKPPQKKALISSEVLPTLPVPREPIRCTHSRQAEISRVLPTLSVPSHCTSLVRLPRKRRIRMRRRF